MPASSGPGPPTTSASARSDGVPGAYFGAVAQPAGLPYAAAAFLYGNNLALSSSRAAEKERTVMASTSSRPRSLPGSAAPTP